MLKTKFYIVNSPPLPSPPLPSFFNAIFKFTFYFFQLADIEPYLSSKTYWSPSRFFSDVSAEMPDVWRKYLSNLFKLDRQSTKSLLSKCETALLLSSCRMHLSNHFLAHVISPKSDDKHRDNEPLEEKAKLNDEDVELNDIDHIEYNNGRKSSPWLKYRGSYLFPQTKSQMEQKRQRIQTVSFFLATRSSIEKLIYHRIRIVHFSIFFVIACRNLLTCFKFMIPMGMELLIERSLRT
jgi:hypothetical protein